MKNKLVQYRGGGYDGCIWEWNYCCFDSDGKWQDIYHSGWAGWKTEESLINYMENNTLDEDYYVYDIDQAGIDLFAKESNPCNVLDVAKALNNLEYIIKIKCLECGLHSDPDEMFLEDWRGCGGIMSTADSLICHDCHAMGSCAYCGEYLGSDFCPDEDGYCVDCSILTRENQVAQLRGYKLEFGNSESINNVKRIVKLLNEIDKIKKVNNYE